MRSPLSRAKGLGAAKEGVSHWWLQRLTAVALTPLLLWSVYSIIGLVGADHGQVVAWMSQPVNTALFVILLVALFYHAELGLQVIIEDYVHGESAKITSLILAKFAMIFLSVLAVVSVLRVAFGGQG